MWPLLSAVSGQTRDSLPLRRPVRRAVIGSCSSPITILLFVCVRLAALSYNDGCTESDLKCLRDSLSNHCQDDPPQYTLIMIRGPYTRFTAFTFTPTYMQQTRSAPVCPVCTETTAVWRGTTATVFVFFSPWLCEYECLSELILIYSDPHKTSYKNKKMCFF